MLLPAFSILTQLGGGAASIPAPAAWPPRARDNLLHIHPGVSYTGTADDVQSITLANGVEFLTVGSGNPVRIDDEGLHFGMGKYLSYTLPTPITYSGVGVFVRFTPLTIPSDPYPPGLDSKSYKAVQAPLALPPKTAFNYTLKQNGTVGASLPYDGFEVKVSGTSTIITDSPNTFGGYFSSQPGEQEYGGALAVWLNGSILHARDLAEDVSVSQLTIGQLMYGALHEGYMFTQQSEAEHELFEAGENAQWVMRGLAGEG